MAFDVFMRSTFFATLVSITAITPAVAISDVGSAVPSKVQFLQGFADVVQPLLPAVVNISATTEIKSMTRGDQLGDGAPFPEGRPFDDFFREFFENMHPMRPRTARALGSGFIVDPSGYVVTNNHVVADADQVTVILNDNTELKAQIVGRDNRTDLALLKVNTPKPLPFVSWGNSDKARVGDWVVAIGNPFGLGGTVTSGIVSAISRDLSISSDGSSPTDLVPGYIQTDASINVGNSGGPMFNTSGEVIGVNRAIFSPTGSSIGIGFAIPSSIAKGVVDQLKQYGRTRRGWIGVRVLKVNEDIADSMALQKVEGALVGSVIPDGPAEKAGIKQGDVILSINGTPLLNSKYLPVFVSTLPIGKPAPVEVWRKGKKISLQVIIGEFEEAEKSGALDQADNKKTKVDPVEGTKILGLSLHSLDAQTRKYFDLPHSITNGLVIMEVDPSSQAAQKGLQRGDIILEISQEEVSSPQQVAKLIEQAKASKRKALLFLVNRNGDLHFVTLRLDWKGESD